QHAESATNFAASASDMRQGCSDLLSSTLKSMQAQQVDLQETLERKWGKIVMEGGKQFTAMLQSFNKDRDGMRVSAGKMVEQGEGILPTELAAVKKAVALIEEQSKVEERIPRLMKRTDAEINNQILEVQKIVDGAKDLFKKFEVNYETATAQLTKLK